MSVKGRSRRAAGSEVPHPRVNPIYQALYEELCQARRRLLGGRDTALPLDGDVARHIDRFHQKYDKSFAKDTLIGADLIDRIHNCVQVFLHSCNVTFIDNVESGALAEFGGLQKKVERRDWLITTTGWFDQPTPKE